MRLAQQGKEPKEQLLDILEFAWLKNKTPRQIATKFKTSYLTIYRIIQDLSDPTLKQSIINFLETTPRKKVFFNRDLETSDYETVQDYINHAKRVGLKKWKQFIMMAVKVWKHLKYKDPARWHIDEVLEFLRTKKEGSGRSAYFDAIRQVAPQFKDPKSPDYFSTNNLRVAIPRRKKDIFFKEFMQLLTPLKKHGLKFHAMILKLHVALGCREGSKDEKSGLCGITWDRFKEKFTLVDIYETKVKKGIWWRNCPTDLIFPELPSELNETWKARGKPITGKLILNHYQELLRIYKEIRECLKEFYTGKLEPSLFNELTNLKPHDADKIHCNLLFEAEASCEDIAGEYKGGTEGSGNMGRGWLDINTIWKYYLTYSARSQRFQRKKRQVKTFCRRIWQGETRDPDTLKIEAISKAFPELNPSTIKAIMTMLSSDLETSTSESIAPIQASRRSKK